MRALTDRVVVRERADLDPDSLMLFMPDTAKKFEPTAVMGHVCYAEVVSVGPGSIEQPSISSLSVGDVVMFDLANCDHAFIEEGRGYQVLPQKALFAKALVEPRPSRALPGQPGHGEVVPTVVGMQPLLDWVLTTEDREAAQKFISKSVLAPDDLLSAGQRTDRIIDGNMRLVTERVVSHGPGRRYAIRLLPSGDPKRLAYDDVRGPDRWVERETIPRVEKGALVAFNPSASSRFRFSDGKFYRITMWDEFHGVV